MTEERLCKQCQKPLTGKSIRALYCDTNCQHAFFYQHSVKVKNIKLAKNPRQTQGFLYENIGGVIIQKPMEDHVYHPRNFTKMDDRTNYYRGNGVFGYDDHVAVGIEDESSIE